jgi:hypothetical protein
MFVDETHAEYLTLALDARKFIDLLMMFVRTGARDARFDAVLVEAVDCLRSDGNPEQVFQFGIHAHLPKLTFEQMATLNEIRGFSQRRDLGNGLERILVGPHVPDEERRLAMDAIEFFYRLESCALHRYNQPSQIYPGTANFL